MYTKEICRNTNIEILRLILMICIFVLHIFVHGFGFKNYGNSDYELNPYITFVFVSLFAPATYCFMFISGYYGIRFSLKKFITMELWLVFVSIFTCAVKISFIPSDKFDFKGIVYSVFCSLFPVSTFHWWFMTNYMLLFLLIPILNMGLEKITKKQFQIILFGLLIYNVISFLRLNIGGGSDFIGLLTIFLLGRYCMVYSYRIRKKSALLIFLLCWIILFALMMACNLVSHKSVFLLLNYNTPFIFVMALSLFYYVKGLKEIHSSHVNMLLRPTLFIYLLTEGISLPLYKWLAKLFSLHIVEGIIAFIMVIVGSLILGHLIIYIVSKIIDKSSKLNLSILDK